MLADSPPATQKFVHATAARLLDDQYRWIDTIDSKAGVLLAAGAVLLGLLTRTGSLALGASRWLLLPIVLLVGISMALAVWAFRTREYAVIDLKKLVTLMDGDEGDAIQVTLDEIVDCYEKNETAISKKAQHLSRSGISLFVAGILVAVQLVFVAWGA